MKATLHFNLEDEIDKHAFGLATTAKEMALFLNEFESLLRSKCKYGTEQEHSAWQPVRDEFYRLKSEYDFKDL